MPSNSNNPADPSRESLLRENAALKRQIEWLSRQLYGRVMPGLFAIPSTEADSDGDAARTQEAYNDSGSRHGAFHESAAPYHVSPPASVPPDLPEEELTLELSPAECAGMGIAGFEPSEAVAMRPALVRRNIRRTMYVSNDGSGAAAAADAPALFPDPSGGPLVFDASFVAFAADLHVAGWTFPAISGRMKAENGLEISADALRGLVLAAAETIAPVCAAMVVRTLPGWTNLRRMFEDAKAGGDWLADGFLEKIHMLCELEEHARRKADRAGGTPEDVYRERRAVRVNSIEIAERLFRLCRETLPGLDARSPLAEAIRYALEHESFLSGFLHDPSLELARANPETPVADPFAMLAVCADECRTHGVSFRAWLEHALIMLKQTDPPPPETLFPH